MMLTLVRFEVKRTFPIRSITAVNDFKILALVITDSNRLFILVSTKTKNPIKCLANISCYIKNEYTTKGTCHKPKVSIKISQLSYIQFPNEKCFFQRRHEYHWETNLICF